MNILIAYDGSRHADAAIDDLARAGLPDSARALVLSVVDAWLPAEDPPGGKGDTVLPGLKDIRDSVNRCVEAQRKIAETGAARVRRNFPGWQVTSDACADAPAVAIIRRAEGENGGVDGIGTRADLTVIGSRGQGTIKRLLLGSVAQKVMHGLRGSLRIGKSTGVEEPGVSFAQHPPRIVVGVDGSSDSNAAIEMVAARSWPLGTHVLVARYAQGIEGLEHSDAASLAGHSGGTVWSGDAGDASGPIRSRAAREAADAANMIRGGCPGVNVSSVVRLADPSYALVDEAEHWGREASGTPAPGLGIERSGADCIFVGARGVRGLERFFLGSVSAAVAMNAHCSVEIVQRSPTAEA